MHSRAVCSYSCLPTSASTSLLTLRSGPAVDQQATLQRANVHAANYMSLARTDSVFVPRRQECSTQPALATQPAARARDDRRDTDLHERGLRIRRGQISAGSLCRLPAADCSASYGVRPLQRSGSERWPARCFSSRPSRSRLYSQAPLRTSLQVRFLSRRTRAHRIDK